MLLRYSYMPPCIPVHRVHLFVPCTVSLGSGNVLGGLRLAYSPTKSLSMALTRPVLVLAFECGSGFVWTEATTCDQYTRSSQKKQRPRNGMRRSSPFGAFNAWAKHRRWLWMVQRGQATHFVDSPPTVSQMRQGFFSALVLEAGRSSRRTHRSPASLPSDSRFPNEIPQWHTPSKQLKSARMFSTSSRMIILIGKARQGFARINRRMTSS